MLQLGWVSLQNRPGNRTEGIALFKFKDVDNLGPSTAMTK